MTPEQLDILGVEIVDKANNILALQRLPLPATALRDAFAQVLREIRDVAKNLYLDLADDDPWADWGESWAE